MSQGFPEATQPGQKPIINSIFDFSDSALGQLRLWLEQNPPATPITSILGFSQFTAQAATTITTSETRTSTAYGDLATVGPQLTGLPDGKYILLYGAQAFTTNGSGSGAALLAVATDTTSAADVDSAESVTLAAQSVMMLKVATLSNSGNNTVTVKYRQNNAADTATFQRRWLTALRYANK